MLYQSLLRPLIFAATRTNPEQAHDRTLQLLAALGNRARLLRWLHQSYAVQSPQLVRDVCGLQFPNPVGLAAGYDKDGQALTAWAALGFGFVEAGTVTWHAQPGNPQPRLFRLPHSQALINRLGFNNRGAPALARRLQATHWPKELPRLPVGISLGKSRRTPLERALQDYRASLQLLYGYANYFAINVSSPNTPGLRALQDHDKLVELLAGLQRESQRLAAASNITPRPLFVKVAPDLSNPALLDLLSVCSDCGVSGLIATNTTISRDGLQEPAALSAEAGGLSGQPLRARALEVVRFLRRETDGRLPIIGVGGIGSADDALRMLDAGASLLQIYTGLVYRGPGLVREINEALRNL